MSDPIDTSATAPTSRDPESPPPGRAPCPELVWENEGGQLRGGPPEQPPQRLGPADPHPASRMKETP